jgi:predicted negative regulator of RcsB-dependent stress response
MWREETIDLKITRAFEASARVLLSLLVVAVLLAILAGIGWTFYDQRLAVQPVFAGN